MSFRGQLQGFFFGFAIAGGIAMYQLQKDMWSSHRMIMASVRACWHCLAAALLGQDFYNRVRMCCAACVWLRHGHLSNLG